MPTIGAVVAGTGFHNPHLVGRAGCVAGCQVALVREHHNAHDRNAIAVYVEARYLGVFSRSQQIGYLKAPLAKRIAPIIDGGSRVTATISSVYAPEGRDHPRVSLTVTY